MSVDETAAAEISVHLADETATRNLGAALAAACAPGTVVLLDGPLGAGKTTFVAGFARAIGAADAASPSFVIAHRYAGGRMPVWHLDLYRLESAAEIDALDLEQYLPSDGVALVEWAARAAGSQRWPSDRIQIELSFDGAGRRAVLHGAGNGAKAVRLVSEARSLA